jgi:O-antigen/teichoic acid export membrane protein
MLGPAQYAVVASAVAALYLVTLPGVVVQTVSARFTSMAAGRATLGNVPSLLVQVSLLSLVLGVPIAAGLVLFSGPLSRYLQISDERVLYALAATSLLALLVSATRGALIGLRRFVAISINTALDAGSRVISSIGLIAAGFGAMGGVLALVIGPTIAYLQSLTLFGGLRSQLRGDRVPVGDVGRYAALTAVQSIGVTYLYNADVILSKHYLLAGDAGIYAAAAVLGRVIYFLGLTVAQVMFPEVATLHARDEPHFHVVDLSLMMLGALAVFLIFVYAVVPDLVLLPFGASFEPVRPYLWQFASALGLLAIANLVINYFLSIGSVRFVLPLIVACALEPILIALHHSGPGAILQMVIVTMALLAIAMMTLYAIDRIPDRRRITLRT